VSTMILAEISSATRQPSPQEVPLPGTVTIWVVTAGTNVERQNRSGTWFAVNDVPATSIRHHWHIGAVPVRD